MAAKSLISTVRQIFKRLVSGGKREDDGSDDDDAEKDGHGGAEGRPGLRGLSEVNKNVPASVLRSEEIFEFLTAELLRLHPNTLQPVTPTAKLAKYFKGFCPAHEFPYVKALLDEWIGDAKNSIGDFINVLEKLRRPDILKDEGLRRKIGKSRGPDQFAYRSRLRRENVDQGKNLEIGCLMILPGFKWHLLKTGSVCIIAGLPLLWWKKRKKSQDWCKIY